MCDGLWFLKEKTKNVISLKGKGHAFASSSIYFHFGIQKKADVRDCHHVGRLKKKMDELLLTLTLCKLWKMSQWKRTRCAAVSAF